jgi:predicted membrane protein
MSRNHQEGIMSTSRNAHGRIFWGLVLIGLGVLFLLDQMGDLDFGWVVSRYWPVIFIVIGLSIIIGNGFRNSGSGVFFVLFGTFFLLMRLHILSYHLWHYWPVIIIAVGVWILVKPLFRPDGPPDKKKTPELVVDELKVSAVLAGVERRVDSSSFRGGKVEVVLGSAEIDLTGAVPADEETVVYLSVVLGSIELRIPREWRIVIDGTPVLGSIEDKRRVVADAERKGNILLKTSVVLGSIEIGD